MNSLDCSSGCEKQKYYVILYKYMKDRNFYNVGSLEAFYNFFQSVGVEPLFNVKSSSSSIVSCFLFSN